jgi:hypothetical protein
VEKQLSLPFDYVIEQDDGDPDGKLAKSSPLKKNSCGSRFDWGMSAHNGHRDDSEEWSLLGEKRKYRERAQASKCP